MGVGLITKEDSPMEMPRPFPIWKRSLAQDLIPRASPSSSDIPKHVVIVMDGLREFSMEAVEWVLKYIAFDAHCNITLLGVSPWLNIPLSSKTWSDIWTMDIEDLTAITERIELKNDVKYQKVHRLVDICKRYGVKPQMRTAMGFPLRLVVLENITSLHATLVVFDRHHRKHREYYAERVPCNMVMMNDDGDHVDMIRGRSHLIDNGDVESTPGESSSLAPTPKLIISEEWRMKILKQ